MRIKGLIYTVNLYKKIISIKVHNKLKIFYFQNNLWKKFRKYLYEGNIIDLVAYDGETLHDHVFAYLVMYVIDIESITPYNNLVLYNKGQINNLLKDFFKSLDNILFIDTEMTMPSYQRDDSFVAELIQAGFIVVNKKGQIIEKYNFHIRPTKMKSLNNRTKEFLHLTEGQFYHQAVSYYKFYNKFKDLLNKYHPAVITFGKNDKLFLESSYKVNRLPSLSFMTRYVNLSQIIKNYYELRQDPGLFTLYERYYNIPPIEQAHDALEDAIVTKKVYDAFIKEVEA